MRAIERERSGWFVMHKVAMGQLPLIAVEASTVGILIGSRTVMVWAIAFGVFAHLWAWRQVIWRRRDITALIRALRQVANEEDVAQ